MANSSLRVAAVQNDGFTVVLNKGEKDGIKVGQRYQIYGIGEEIKDPDTQETLGRLEVIRGTGKVTHVQDRMATVNSDMKGPTKRKITKPPTFEQLRPYGVGGLARMFGPAPTTGEIEEIIPPESLYFDSPQEGDYARLI